MVTSKHGNVPQAAQFSTLGVQTQEITNSNTSSSKPDGQKTKHGSRDKRTGNRYFPALAIVAAVFPVPVLAALLSIVFYLAPSTQPARNSTPVLQQLVDFLRWLGPSNQVILLGIGVTLVICLLLAAACTRFATPEGGRLSDYDALDREILLLKSQHETLKEQEPQVVGNTAPSKETDQDHQLARKIILNKVETELDEIQAIMRSVGLPWALSTGYVNLWNRVNRVNEAMIWVLPDERLIEDATYDLLRLQGSVVPNEEDLHDNLVKAIEALRLSDQASNATNSPHAANASDAESVLPKPHGKQSPIRSLLSPIKKDDSTSVPPHVSKGVETGQCKTETNQNKAETPLSKAEAKKTIYQARCALHKFTNERWDGLVRSRNQLMGTSILVGFMTYILVIIAIIAKAPQSIIEKAMVFYLLGAVVGLFSQLYNEWNSKDPVKDDYGLTAARVLVTPLLSGLAALVGVFLVTMLSITLITPQNNSGTTSSTGSATPTVTVGSTSTPVSGGTTTATPTLTTGTPQPVSGATTAGSFPKIETIYDFDMYPQNLVLAAIFGFLPSLVIGLLLKETDKIESQIQSSSAGDQKQGTEAGKQESGKGGSD